MSFLSISKDTFKGSFLDGAGTLNLATDQDLWTKLIENNLQFHRGVDRVADVSAKLDADKPFTIGKPGVLALKVKAGFEAGHQIELVWPGELGPTLESYDLPALADDELYVQFRLNAKGETGLSSQFQGPAKIRFGVQAGGDAQVEVIRRYKQAEKVPAILGDLFANVRLPQQVDKKAQVPEEGEVLRLRYGGYLGLSTHMSWGYSLTGSRSVDIAELAADFEYSMALAASVGAQYRLAGEFEILVRRGSRAGWARYTVRKARDSQFQFAADLGLDAEFALTGLPRTADEFLAKVAGADAVSILDKLHDARRFTSLDELQAQTDLLAQDVLDTLALEWLNKKLSNQTLAKVLDGVQQARLEYQALDDKVRGLVEAQIDRLDDLREAVQFLDAATTPAKLRKRLEEDLPAAGKAWDVLEMAWGDDLVEVMLDQSETFGLFREFLDKANGFLTGGEGSARLIGYLSVVRKRLRLDEAFDQLAKIDSPPKLQALADKRLKGLAERLVGETFDQLKTSQFGSALDKLHQALDNVEKFKNKAWAKAVKTVAKQAFEANLSYRYSRTSEREALLDVEVNLNNAEGRALAELAAKGDYRELLAAYRSRNVVILRGELTSKLTKSAHLQISVFGWGASSLRTLVQQSDHAVQPVSGGLLHVFTDETQIKQLRSKKNRRGFEERVASAFLLKSAASMLQPEGAGSSAIDPVTKRFLIRTLPKLSISYDLLHEDDRTTVDELRQYLAFGETMGLLRSQDPNRSAADELAQQLRAEFGEPLGKVKIDYTVRYDNQAIQSMLLRKTGELLNQARRVLRETVAARYIGMPQTHWMARLGFAYLDPALYERFRLDPLLRQRIDVVLPSWFTGGSPLSVTLPNNDLLASLFRTEDAYLRRLGALDELVDRIRDSQAVTIDDLQQASKDFLAMAGKIDNWAVNAFFAVFDGLIQFDSGGKAIRESAMVLEITPPGDTEPIRKIFQSPGAWNNAPTRREGAVLTEPDATGA